MSIISYFHYVLGDFCEIDMSIISYFHCVLGDFCEIDIEYYLIFPLCFR